MACCGDSHRDPLLTSAPALPSQIIRVEGIFSGTLSYIFNTFGDGRSFSDIVKEAKAKGYTEPDPRDDLSGTDVARKVGRGASCVVNALVWLSF